PPPELPVAIDRLRRGEGLDRAGGGGIDGLEVRHRGEVATPRRLLQDLELNLQLFADLRQECASGAVAVEPRATISGSKKSSSAVTRDPSICPAAISTAAPPRLA